MPETQTQQPETINVKGPDSKIYKMPKGTTREKALAYFNAKGIKAPPKQPTTPAAQPQSQPAKAPSGASGSWGGFKGASIAAADYALTGLPTVASILGTTEKAVGAAVSSVTGPEAFAGSLALADLTGTGGKLLEIYGKKALYGSQYGPQGLKNIIHASAKEGMEQAGLEGGGRLLGTGLFKLLDKIPHAEIRNGILLPPSSVSSHKIVKYAEDFLSNALPSAKTMQEFHAKVTDSVVTAANKLADNMSKFRFKSGTAEETGNAVRQVMQAAQTKMAKQYNALKKAQDPAAASVLDQYNKLFNTTFGKKLVSTGRPEWIAGYFSGIANDKGAEYEHLRSVVDLLKETKPFTLAKVKTTIIKDAINQDLRGTADAILKRDPKMAENFNGKKFTEIMDKIGDTRMGIIFNADEKQAIENFTRMTHSIGQAGKSMIGNFYNMMFLMGPLRTSFSFNRIVMQSAVLNTMAKIMVSPNGAKAVENVLRSGYVRNVPKALKLSFDELETHVARAKAQWEEENQKQQEEFDKQHGITKQSN